MLLILKLVTLHANTTVLPHNIQILLQEYVQHAQ